MRYYVTYDLVEIMHVSSWCVPMAVTQHRLTVVLNFVTYCYLTGGIT